MNIPNDVETLTDFVERWSGVELFSTGAKVVDYSGVLYNVDGSSDDPTIDGLNWKRLLIFHGVSGNCYVTNVVPPRESSHPGFNVGGHMTINSDGSVERGGTCYLIPLCKWHNSTSRNGRAFELRKTTMIRLSGYMEGEPSATFLARLPNESNYTAVVLSNDTNDLESFLARRRANEKSDLLESFSVAGSPEYFVLFKRIKRGDKTVYVIDEARLPN